MPSLRRGEKRNKYVGRAVPEMMSEGLTQKQAVGKAEGMYSFYKKHPKKKYGISNLKRK